MTIDFSNLRKSHFQAENVITTAAKEVLAQSEHVSKQIHDRARALVSQVRAKRLQESGIDAFLTQYDLSSEEGISLMCMAEALLRIPDKSTVDALIKDKLTTADWQKHIGASESSFVNAATWGLSLTRKLLPTNNDEKANIFKRMLTRTSEPVIRNAIRTAMKILGGQFVMGQTIEKAISRAREFEKKGYYYSYDMLGEAAYTMSDAEYYYQAYLGAIEALAKHPRRDLITGPSISVKLSALYPRYESKKLDDVLANMMPKLRMLVKKAREIDVSITIDAEESERLEISLILFKELFYDESTKDWPGLGLALQAYQKRAMDVLELLKSFSEERGKKISIRLVKGAYWDTEIKRAQVMGLPGYPVFTRKVATDVNYLACAKTMLASADNFYCQFATHNAHTVASILQFADKQNFEFQCLHGMGETLYDDLVKQGHKCRIYAPVGSHEHLLAYLVRRLLENGANTSFVNQIADESIDINELIEDPIMRLSSVNHTPHPRIPLPKSIYGDRENSKGVDIGTFKVLDDIAKVYANEFRPQEIGGERLEVTSPIDGALVGYVAQTDPDKINDILDKAAKAQRNWANEAYTKRARILEIAADKLEENTDKFIKLLALEAGKTLDDAIAEIREAVDFCRYYALQAREMGPVTLKGPTGEENILSYEARGIIVCISPWNFPLAIFTGQVVAALVTGNAVLAKSANQTPLVARAMCQLLHEAGVPKNALVQLAISGRKVSEHILPDSRIAGVMVTGSTETARAINQTLAARDGAIVPLIAETGGQNAMIVDSTALPEQVVRDVIMSAFKSAGQRCSALRVLFLQEDVADKMLEMIIGSMAVQKVGSPLDITTDIGPVIDEQAANELRAHIDKMKLDAKYLAHIKAPDGACYVSPHLFEIDNINVLENEVFGPVLHVVRYKADELAQVVKQINSTGFGLTFGVHTRVNTVSASLAKMVHAGNVYINRNMIGAVVGVQPFGGQGLSGTGPKAGGPNYLKRLVHEKVVSTDTTAQGGNASLVSLAE